jgi:hypothetical protein
MEEIEAAGGIGAGESFDEFIADAFGGDDFGIGGKSAKGFPGGGFDGEAELDGEADGAEEAEAVFGKAGEGIADGADLLGSEIGLALDVVEEFIFEGIKKHAVDGEVATLSILLGGGEGDGGRAATVKVRAVDAEGGDVEDVIVDAEADDAEGFALGIGGFGEEGLDLVGGGRGGDIDIGIGAVEEGIADATSGVNGDVAGLGKFLNDLFSLGVADHVLGWGDLRVR